MSLSTPQGRVALRTRQIVEFAIWISLAAGMWMYSYSFDQELSTYAFGPVAWPRAIIILIAAVATLTLLSDWRTTAAATADDKANEEADQPADRLAQIRLAAAILLPLAYVWLLPRAGYFAATPIFIAAYMRVLGIERWRVIIVTTLIAYALLLLFFSKLLYIPLPTGNWPVFYEFSNWLLVWLGNV